MEVVEAEERLHGVFVLRTSVLAETLISERVVLGPQVIISHVERASRSLKSI